MISLITVVVVACGIGGTSAGSPWTPGSPPTVRSFLRFSPFPSRSVTHIMEERHNGGVGGHNWRVGGHEGGAGGHNGGVGLQNGGAGLSLHLFVSTPIRPFFTHAHGCSCVHARASACANRPTRDFAKVHMAHFQLGSFLIGLVSNWLNYNCVPS